MNIKDLPVHHAILITTNSRTATSDRLFKELQELSPAHTFFNQTVLDIKDARSIIYWANTAYNEEKIALISFHTMGLEAQNALLKILEEPRKGVRFILITSNLSNLIETVLSRLLILHDKESSTELTEARNFLSSSHEMRIKLPYVIDILSRVDEEDRKDRESIRSFILSLTQVLETMPNTSRYTKETLELASYAADPSAGGKALLEYISLLLPKSKV